MKRALLGIGLLALGLSGCATSTLPAAAPAAPSAVIVPAMPAPAADDNLNAVLWVQTSAEYQALTAQTYHSAAQLLDRALRDRSWSALVPEERVAAKALPPAVILDVDETVLDNSPYQARLIRNAAEYGEKTWDAWVEERKARALPGVVEFAKAAQARGVTLLYISNRGTHLKDATLANLQAVGMPVKDESVFLGLGTVVEGCEQRGSEKSCRRRLAARKYRVIMQFGDQLGDFVQVHPNLPDVRSGLLGDYRAWFGERWWMLANPTYGSWEPALFGNDFARSREARRAAKREALRTEESAP